jgi:mannose-6-phosphate isomerase-like protein (cupin superfamily)
MTIIQRVEKGWGYELIFANNHLYCGKILHLTTGKKCSLHFHIEKTETWYIYSGKFIGKFINTIDGSLYEKTLNVGDVITNEPGQPHQLICLEEGDIFEVSTQHFDCDSYRVRPGSNQENN